MQKLLQLAFEGHQKNLESARVMQTQKTASAEATLDHCCESFALMARQIKQALASELHVAQRNQRDQFTQIDLDAATADQANEPAPKSEQFLNFNFTMKKVAERQLVNSWNIKDPIQYKKNLQKTFDPDFWQWL